MTRFQTNARLNYSPVERDKPGKQLMGLYNMWQSLSPSTRDTIAGWFSRKGKVDTGVNPAFDTALVYGGQPELEDPELEAAAQRAMVGSSEDYDRIGNEARLNWNELGYEPTRQDMRIREIPDLLAAPTFVIPTIGGQ